MSNYLKRYLDILRVGPRATFEEVTNNYYLILDQISRSSDERVRDRANEIRHAYQILRRAYESKRKSKKRR